MASKIRTLVASKVIHAMNEMGMSGGEINAKNILPFISVDPKPHSETKFAFSLPVNRLPVLNYTDSCASKVTSDLIHKFDTDRVIPSISTAVEGDKAHNIKLHFGVDKYSLTKLVLDEVVGEPLEFWKKSDLFMEFPREKMVVEFSSPNIAKPFHVGHLRSTIIGNFISNLHEALGNQVIRLNFLGDWGTQFGLLNVGVAQSQYSMEEIEKNPMPILFDIYVKANQEAEKNPEMTQRAREAFKRLEKGSKEERDRWQAFRNYTIAELKNMYKRLGVRFDEYHGESMYSSKDIEDVLQRLRQMQILHSLPDGREVVHIDPGKTVTLVKSDGSSLYLARDLAAALHRQNKYNFNHIYYVVDNSQTDHFVALQRILQKMGEPFAENLHHVKFGRILGMSTRKGNVVFLKDVLDQAKDILLAKQKQSSTTRGEAIISGETADVLAVTSILVNDMKQRRHRDYTFDWEKVMENAAYSGVRLQYTHCRLNSLVKNCGVGLVLDCPITSLKEKEAMYLIGEIARFEEVLMHCREELEPCIMVQYLFQISNSINSALKILPVKGQPAEVAEARLLLFYAANLTLKAGMTVLGLQPLQEM